MATPCVKIALSCYTHKVFVFVSQDSPLLHHTQPLGGLTMSLEAKHLQIIRNLASAFGISICVHICINISYICLSTHQSSVDASKHCGPMTYRVCHIHDSSYFKGWTRVETDAEPEAGLPICIQATLEPNSPIFSFMILATAQRLVQ